jgi:hypothetical protein
LAFSPFRRINNLPGLRAFVYNTPVLGIDFGYAEAVQAAAARIGSAVGVFDKIFVYVPVTEGQRVFRLYPP